jgi:inner membrane protein
LPTVITHALVGVVASKASIIPKMSMRFCLLSVFCSVLPDADVIAFDFGIPYHHLFGHRGFFHSPFFGLLLGLLVVFIFFRSEKIFSRQWWMLFIYFSLLTASHGILDAFTNGGLGIALLFPFTTQRFFFPWRPIQVSPIGISPFLSRWGLQVLISEFIWIWLPLCLVMVIFRFIRKNNVRINSK